MFVDIQVAEFSASTFTTSPRTVKEAICSHIWDDSYPMQKYRSATRKNRWLHRYYHPGLQHKENYFSYPSVHRLLQEQGIKLDTANIPATGPNGRLLKGDILAYLGRVNQDYLHEQSQRLNNLSRLNLSKSKAASVDAPSQSGHAQTENTNNSSDIGNLERADIEITMPISLDAVFRCQELLRRSLDVSVPLSRFVSQASKIANERTSMPTTSHTYEDTVFDAIVGHEKARRKPKFIPSISSLPVAREPELKDRKIDYLDFLAAKWPTIRVPGQSDRAIPKVVGRPAKTLSVRARKENKGAASTYLKKLKALLEVEPGQLIF